MGKRAKEKTKMGNQRITKKKIKKMSPEELISLDQEAVKKLRPHGKALYDRRMAELQTTT